MKTSNKILLIIIAGIFIGIIIAAIVVRVNTRPDFLFNAKVVFAGRQSIIGSGKIITKSYKFSDFDAIRVSGENRITIYTSSSKCRGEITSPLRDSRLRGNDKGCGEQSQVNLSADANLFGHINVYVENKTLYIKPDDNYSIDPSRPVNVVINTKALQEINVAGANKIYAANINTKKLALNIAGATKCYLSGKVDNLYLNISGASKILAGNLIAKNVKIKTAGMAHITVHVNNTLDTTIMGGGKIQYYGHPSQITQHIAGSGEIKYIGGK